MRRVSLISWFMFSFCFAFLETRHFINEIFPTQCPRRRCLARMTCGPEGFEEDDDGCPICRCKLERPCTGPTVRCGYQCPNGFKKNPITNCPTCECKMETPKCTGPTVRCGNRCGPHGYKVNPRTNCPTCECDCPKLSCSACLRFGNKLDQFGCRTCECLDGPCARPQNPIRCGRRRCAQGHVIDDNGCKTCECQGNKPGVCDTTGRIFQTVCGYECNTDKSCPGNEKCCDISACANKCLPPKPVSGGGIQDCPNIQPTLGQATICALGCSRLGDCRSNEVCCKYGCTSQCIQKRKLNGKSGQCPSVQRHIFGTCEEECKFDHSCPGNKKCCSNGCGHTCQFPDSVPLVKPGMCPRIRVSHPCRNECDNDYDCSGNRKCCSHRCGKKCVGPKHSIRPGTCPPVSRRPCFGRRRNRCEDDSNCRGNRKCCQGVCGKICVRGKRYGE